MNMFKKLMCVFVVSFLSIASITAGDCDGAKGHKHDKEEKCCGKCEGKSKEDKSDKKCCGTCTKEGSEEGKKCEKGTDGSKEDCKKEKDCKTKGEK